ncbi:hypothetical protein M758_10G181400 [Ceratodon purpureus]|nr:hypothetical protein M758_10G181400 [Ceratodon purpureus]
MTTTGYIIELQSRRLGNAQFPSSLNITVHMRKVSERLTVGRAREQPHGCQKRVNLSLPLAFPCTEAEQNTQPTPKIETGAHASIGQNCKPHQKHTGEMTAKTQTSRSAPVKELLDSHDQKDSTAKEKSKLEHATSDHASASHCTLLRMRGCMTTITRYRRSATTLHTTRPNRPRPARSNPSSKRPT